MKLKPLHDWVVLVPADAEERTAGGLYIPDTAKEKPKEGIVEAAGPGALEEEKPGRKKKEGEERKFVPTVVKPGDRVLYEGWSGQTIKIGTDERVVVRERSILGYIDRTAGAAMPAPRPSTDLAERKTAALPAVRSEELAATRTGKTAAPQKSAKKTTTSEPAKRTAKKASTKKTGKKK